MKTRFFIAAALLLSVSLTQAQNVTVDADKKLNTDFSKYKTYTWASQVDNQLDPGLYFLNDLALKKRIRDAVAFALDGRGYKFTRQSPDLLVNFRVFDKAATVKGYTGYGSTYFGSNEVRDPEDVTTFDIKPGSIVVNLVDVKTGQVVWRGLATGLTNTNGFDRDENKIKQAVNLIFEQYSFRADKL
ncbi:DUF4136 domain-containing protein [Spirosoma taeanense]|uniref:DUF4136 domain-containing protein n=1 Tax=Spirosoma taeanense TaxID=2735870 RepID=A0A6M5YC30_9BACT|nr:DUF4136 domain-containing protein [Spirosoma taeanense]QJW91529.1 DUF4136 domain-containing protein [Spirosoma taeanense]